VYEEETGLKFVNELCIVNNQGDLFRGLGFRASGGLVWLLSYPCRVEVPCLARARRTFKNAKFGIIPRCRPKPKITIQ